jgi:hypothetical protein
MGKRCKKMAKAKVIRSFKYVRHGSKERELDSPCTA